MKDGLYKVSFAALEQGHGVVVIRDETIQGGDGGFYYSGSFVVSDSKVASKIVAAQHSPEAISVFGNISKLTLSFTGTATENTAQLTGFAAEMPNVPLKVSLTPLVVE